MISHGCFYCKVGKEKDTVLNFTMVFPRSKAIVPTRTRYRRKKDSVIEEQVPLLPGYVFFEIEEESIPTQSIVDLVLLELQKFSHADSVLKLLRYNDGGWRLLGADNRFVKMLFKNDGNIGISQAYFDEGKRIRILNGFLKDYEGSIVRVNKKTKTAEVIIDLQGKKVSMWLGYELMEPVGSGAESNQ